MEKILSWIFKADALLYFILLYVIYKINYIFLKGTVRPVGCLCKHSQGQACKLNMMDLMYLKPCNDIVFDVVVVLFCRLLLSY